MSEEQKTVRVCWPLFHRYTRWERAGYLVRSKDKSCVGEAYTRDCVRCGRVKKRNIRWDE